MAVAAFASPGVLSGTATNAARSPTRSWTITLFVRLLDVCLKDTLKLGTVAIGNKRAIRTRLVSQPTHPLSKSAICARNAYTASILLYFYYFSSNSSINSLMFFRPKFWSAGMNIFGSSIKSKLTISL